MPDPLRSALAVQDEIEHDAVVGRLIAALVATAIVTGCASAHSGTDSSSPSPSTSTVRRQPTSPPITTVFHPDLSFPAANDDLQIRLQSFRLTTHNGLAHVRPGEETCEVTFTVTNVRSDVTHVVRTPLMLRMLVPDLGRVGVTAIGGKRYVQLLEYKDRFGNGQEDDRLSGGRGGREDDLWLGPKASAVITRVCGDAFSSRIRPTDVAFATEIPGPGSTAIAYTVDGRRLRSTDASN